MHTHPARRSNKQVMAVLVASLLAACIVPTPSGAATRRRVTRRVVAPSLLVRVLGDEQTVQAGQTAKYSFAVTTKGTLSALPTFDVPEVPPGVTATITAVSATSYELQMTTATTAIGGSAVYVLRGRAGNLQTTALFRLSVTAAPTTTSASTASTSTVVGDFSLIADTQSRVVVPGETATFGIRIDRRNVAEPVAMRVEGLPGGVEANFAPDPTQANTNLYVTPSVQTPSGTYLLVITGSARGLTRTVSTRMIVRRVGSFNFRVSPTALTVAAGTNAATNVIVTPLTTDAGVPNVVLELLNVPVGVALQTVSTEGQTSRIVLSTTVNTPAGTFPISIIGRSGTFARTTVLTLTVTRTVAGFGISAQPTTLNVSKASTGSYAVTVVPANGFASEITYTVLGLPATTAATVSSATNGVKITIAATADTVASTYPLKIVARSGALEATIAVTLVVTAPAV